MLRLNSIFAAIICCGLAVVALTGARADTHGVLLTMEIDRPGAAIPWRLELTYDDLLDLPSQSIVTATNWTRGVHEFTGVPLTALLEHIDVQTGQIEMIAINDYSIRFEADDPTNQGALVAYQMDGERMTRRDKGPLWLVYNYDSDRAYRTETIFSRSIWQLDRINISR